MNNQPQTLPNFEKELPAHMRFLSIRYISRFLGISQQHVTNLIDTGEIETSLDLRSKASPRSCIRVPRRSLLAFLNNRSTA